MLPAAAYDWAVKGISQVSASEEGVLTLRDQQGNVFLVEEKGVPVNETIARDILQLKSSFLGYTYIKARTLKFTSTGQGIAILVLPESFNYQTKDFLPNVPSGLEFMYQNKILNYSFRMTVDNLFLRIQGVFLDEESLCKKMEEALVNPQNYIRRRDPEYFVTKIDELEQRAIKSEGDNQRLQNELELFKQATVGLHNTGFFSDKGPLAADKLTRILELKRERPEISVEEMEKILKEQNITVSVKEIKLVFRVYFNDFRSE
jgi:hypothetical protein